MRIIFINICNFLFFIIFGFFIQISAVPSLPIFDLNPTLLFLLFICLFFIVFFISLKIFLNYSKESFAYFKNSLCSIKFSQIFISYLFILFFTFIYLIVSDVLFGVSNYSQVQSRLNIIMSTPIMFVINMISINITQPILEEFFYRGVILNYFKNSTNNVISIIISAAMFSWFHNGSIISEHFVFGLITGHLFIKTNNLYSCIMVHCLVNISITSINFIAG